MKYSLALLALFALNSTATAGDIKIYPKEMAQASKQQNNTKISASKHDTKISKQQHKVAPSGSGSHGASASSYMFQSKKGKKVKKSK